MNTQPLLFPRKQLFFSRKGWTSGLIIWGVIALLVIIILIPISLKGFDSVPWVVFLILCAIVVLLTWIWFGTYYVLTPYYLSYSSGPFRGKIPISSIVWVQHQHTLLSGSRPALAFNGLLIRYNKYDEIYISPAEKAAFIYALQQLNPTIKVKLDNEA